MKFYQIFKTVREADDTMRRLLSGHISENTIISKKFRRMIVEDGDEYYFISADEFERQYCYETLYVIGTTLYCGSQMEMIGTCEPTLNKYYMYFLDDLEEDKFNRSQVPSHWFACGIYETYEHYDCPYCDYNLISDLGVERCPNCNQRIDWTGVEIMEKE